MVRVPAFCPAGIIVRQFFLPRLNVAGEFGAGTTGRGVPIASSPSKS